MVVLAHIREQFRLSLGSYGRPHMTEESKDLRLLCPLKIGKRRLMTLRVLS
jgi:hypothetical protein